MAAAPRTRSDAVSSLGMPPNVRSVLLRRSYQPFILVIAIANALYCALTAIVLIGFWQHISAITSIYFMLEICVITALVYIELRVWLLLRKMDLPK